MAGVSPAFSGNSSNVNGLTFQMEIGKTEFEKMIHLYVVCKRFTLESKIKKFRVKG